MKATPHPQPDGRREVEFLTVDDDKAFLKQLESGDLVLALALANSSAWIERTQRHEPAILLTPDDAKALAQWLLKFAEQHTLIADDAPAKPDTARRDRRLKQIAHA